ncbi:MAG TPA: hypothetical protein PKC28_13095 [Bdellovibrionales bacterium]|nr:hypothetical protein [Bdellovibrionales bacterium]
MIEILEAEQGGAKVLRVDGCLTASRVAPVKEAREWLARRREFLDKVKTVFVLGLGSGHHVRALRESCRARIVVVEANADIVSMHAELGIVPADVQVLHADSLRALRGNERVRELVTASFVVLTHPASVARGAEVYHEFRRLLIGRDWGTLNWQWNMRNGPSLDGTTRISGEDQAPLTIYDLEQTELVQNSEEGERLVFKALRELVK